MERVIIIRNCANFNGKDSTLDNYSQLKLKDVFQAGNTRYVLPYFVLDLQFVRLYPTMQSVFKRISKEKIFGGD